MEIDLSQPAAQIAAAVLFLVPGLNATWAIERLTGPNRLRGTERLLRALSFSVLIYAAASPWLVDLGRRVLHGARISPWEPILGLSALIFVAPVALSLIVLFLRQNRSIKALLRLLTTIDPTPRAWDFAFKERDGRFVRLKLHGGERVGGVFADNSFAAAHPERQDLFLEQAWRLEKDGSFVEPVAETGGILVLQESIELVELLPPEEVRRHGRRRQGKEDSSEDRHP